MTRRGWADPPHSRLAGRLWRWSASHSDTRPVRIARRLVHVATRYVHAENHDIETNGEAHLLDCLGADARVIFDVGACVGDWSAVAVARCPNATVYGFEISSTTRRVLADRFAAEPRVRIMEPGGLAERNGVVPVKRYPAAPELTSMYDYPHDSPSTWVEEPVVTGDAVVAALAHEGIDLLKLDCEGAELLVLQGLRETLGRAAVRVIQFEYGYAAVFSHALLADYHRLLEPLGYRIGRLGSDGVTFASYHVEDERFFGPNFVAVRADESQLIRSLVSRSQASTSRR